MPETLLLWRVGVTCGQVGKAAPDAVGVDLASRHDIWQLVRNLAADGATVLLTTQYLDEADHLADRIAVIDHGRLVTEGTASALKDRIGGAVVELTVPTAQHDAALTALMSPAPQCAADRIVLLASDGPLTLRRALRLLDEAAIVPADVALHGPTLDDVFFTLTRGATNGRFAGTAA